MEKKNIFRVCRKSSNDVISWQLIIKSKQKLKGLCWTGAYLEGFNRSHICLFLSWMWTLWWLVIAPSRKYPLFNNILSKIPIYINSQPVTMPLHRSSIKITMCVYNLSAVHPNYRKRNKLLASTGHFSPMPLYRTSTALAGSSQVVSPESGTGL